jgi:hypothetical protein
MDGLDCFPPKMRVDYPHKFFNRIIEKYNGEFNLVWSHLPEWTNEFKSIESIIKHNLLLDIVIGGKSKIMVLEMIIHFGEI